MASTTSSLIRRMSLMEFLAIDEDETGPKCELEYGELIKLMRPMVVIYAQPLSNPTTFFNPAYFRT